MHTRSDEYSLTDTMARFGQLASCRLVAHGAIGPVGFVTFKDKDEAERFIQLAGRGTQPTPLRVAGPPMRRAHGAPPLPARQAGCASARAR